MTAPAYTANLDDSIFSAADEMYSTVKDWLESGETAAMTESELQRELEPRGRELMRCLMQAHTTLRCQRVPSEPVVGEDGKRRTHVRKGAQRHFATIFGLVEAVRQGFGGRDMDSRFPVDADLNLPKELHSLEVRRRCAVEAARGSYDEGVAALAATTGAGVAKRQFEELAIRAAQDFDAFYDATALDIQAAQTGSILVLTCDAKGIVMRFESLRPATQKAAKQSEHKLTTRLSKGEKANRKRMATAAAVYTIVPWVRTPESIVERMRGLRDAINESPRPRPEHKRVWASVAKTTKKVVAQAYFEAHTRDPLGDKRWVVLVDGERNQLRNVRKEAKRIGIEPTIIVDFIHVLEYLWKAAYVFNKEGTVEAEQWVYDRLLRVLQGKAPTVAAGIRRSATLRGLSKAKRKSADKCAKYLHNNAQHLRYHEYLADGLPIATGVIEGACRHLIGDRMDITGARWGLEGAEAVLRLRSLRSSGDFGQYWAFHEEQERIRNHHSRYADGRPPAVVAPAAHRHLRVVK
jgi:hypothetical protein